MKIDTSEWKEFKFGNLIDEIYKAQAHSKLSLDVVDKPKQGYVPFISRTEINNSVDCYAPIEQVELEQGNALVIGDTTSTISYQSDPFTTGDHIVVIRADWLNKYTGMFVVTLLNNERFRYSYGRAFIMASIENTSMLLPEKNGEPDWQWIEDYVRSLHSEPITTSCDNPLQLDSVSWGNFKLGGEKGLFDVKYGINMELNACTETDKDDPEAIAFVARTSENNGISAFVKPEEGKIPQPANTITVAGGGSVLSTFLQIRPFYSGRDLYLLIPKQEISNYMKLFIVTVLQAEKYRFNYGRQANKTLPDLNLHLPATADGEPDWQFMEDYIKSLPYGDRI